MREHQEVIDAFVARYVLDPKPKAIEDWAAQLSIGTGKLGRALQWDEKNDHKIRQIPNTERYEVEPHVIAEMLKANVSEAVDAIGFGDLTTRLSKVTGKTDVIRLAAIALEVLMVTPIEGMTEREKIDSAILEMDDGGAIEDIQAAIGRAEKPSPRHFHIKAPDDEVRLLLEAGELNPEFEYISEIVRYVLDGEEHPLLDGEIADLTERRDAAKQKEAA